MTTTTKPATSKLAQVAKLQKTCLGPCQKMRPAADFATASNRPDGLQTWCRDCVRASERIRAQRLEAFGETDAMKLAEAALMLGVPQYRVKKMCERGELRCVDIGTSGSVFWRISRTHVLELLAAQQTTDGTVVDGQPIDDTPAEAQPTDDAAEVAATGGGRDIDAALVAALSKMDWAVGRLDGAAMFDERLRPIADPIIDALGDLSALLRS